MTRLLLCRVTQVAGSGRKGALAEQTKAIRGLDERAEAGLDTSALVGGESTYRRLSVALLSGEVHVQLELVLASDVGVAGLAAAERVDAPDEGPLGLDIDHHLGVGAFQRHVVTEAVRVAVLLVIRRLLQLIVRTRQVVVVVHRRYVNVARHQAALAEARGRRRADDQVVGHLRGGRRLQRARLRGARRLRGLAREALARGGRDARGPEGQVLRGQGPRAARARDQQVGRDARGAGPQEGARGHLERGGALARLLLEAGERAHHGRQGARGQARGGRRRHHEARGLARADGRRGVHGHGGGLREGAHGARGQLAGGDVERVHGAAGARVHAQAAGRRGARHQDQVVRRHRDRGGGLLLLVIEIGVAIVEEVGALVVDGRQLDGVVADGLQVDGVAVARVEQRLGHGPQEGVAALGEGALVQVVEGAVGLARLELRPEQDRAAYELVLDGAGARAARLRLDEHLLVRVVVELDEVGRALRRQRQLGVIVEARVLANVLAQQAGVLEVVDCGRVDEVAAVRAAADRGGRRGRRRQVDDRGRAAVEAAQRARLGYVIVLERAAHEPLLGHAGRLARLLGGRVEGGAVALPQPLVGEALEGPQPVAQRLRLELDLVEEVEIVGLVGLGHDCHLVARLAVASQVGALARLRLVLQLAGRLLQGGERIHHEAEHGARAGALLATPAQALEQRDVRRLVVAEADVVAVGHLLEGHTPPWRFGERGLVSLAANRQPHQEGR